jgi:hypothetical protein
VLHVGRPGTPRKRGGGAGSFSVEAALDTLEHFASWLPATPAERLPALALEAVRDALSADAAFLFPAYGTGDCQWLGEPALSPPWCEAFLFRVVGREAEAAGQLLQDFLDPADKPGAPWPCSAALVCLGPDAGTWMAALSFHPRRLFAAQDLRVMQLVRRLCGNQADHLQAVSRWQQTLRLCRQQLGPLADEPSA